jgi:uncharacterized membrane protein YbhN (UPF0104 family)
LMMEPKPKGITWKHLAGFAVTAVLLWFVFRKIPLPSLWAALKGMDPVWFILGFFVYGLSLWFGACRWHMALHLTHRALHILATYRLFLVGHFFYCVLFGAVGGEFAKSAVYARWFRFALPEVIAAAPLDRVLGFGGTILFTLTAIAITYFNHGFEVLKQWKLHLPSGWAFAAAGVAVALVLSLLFWRPTGESSLARAFRAFKKGGSHMAVTPEVIFPGTLFSILGQFGLTSIMAVNLRAVTHLDLPWAQMSWTFPAILVVSAMPFTVAGTGMREMAALAFFGLFGVPPEQCIAASLLTLVHKLSWATVGGIIFWRNGRYYARFKNSVEPKSVTAVIPSLNQEALLAETIRHAKTNREITEIIVVDGGSIDGSRELALQLGCTVLSHDGAQSSPFRAGAQNAKGDVVLLLNTKTLLPPYAALAALNCLRDAYVVAGGFWKMVHPTRPLALGSRFMCALRLIFAKRIAIDQGLFVRRTVLEEVGGVPDMGEKGELELCRRLRKKGRLALADAIVITPRKEKERDSPG